MTAAGAPGGSSPASPTPPFPVPGWDRFHFVRFLGQGGMGRVFLSYDPRLRRNVALKFVRDGDPELMRQFIFEARAQARVNHDRVCKVYEVDEVQGQAYIAMQYIDGYPLNAIMDELTVEQKAILIRDAAEGVHEAHRAGLIHRDLKPSNLMVERPEDGSLKLYVMDFGLARDFKQEETSTGRVLGTPHYMSPEQARGEVARLDRRADVYSLGATLYHVLVGRYPIPGENALEVLANIPLVEPRPLRSLDPDLPADLEAIVLKCLEKDRSARYDSARALAEDLNRFLAGEPILARAADAGYRLRKWLRRNRLVVSVAAVAFTLVVLALSWGAMERREAALREDLARRFTESVEHVEALARYSNLSPLHDIRIDRKAIRAKMGELEAEIREGGARAVGPGHYALGRGYQALGDDERAREYLESAWEHGFQQPRSAYALALVMGHLYRAKLLEAAQLRNPELREAFMREIERRYRDPALAYLRQSEGAEVPSQPYVAALLAFYEDHLDTALLQLDAIGDALPWFYEAPLLRGDIFVARASRHWNRGEREQALADFDAGRRAYVAAAAIGESVPAVHLALGELEYAAMVMELYSQGDVVPHHARGMEAVARALSADPEHVGALLLEARLHRRLAEYRTTRGGALEGLPEKAVAAARRALELAPTRPEPRLELARCFWQWGKSLKERNRDPREQLRKAVELFEGIGPADRSYEFHMQLGLVFHVWAEYEDQIGGNPLPNLDKAIGAYRTAIGLDERLPLAWINLGIVYFERASHARNPDADGDLARAREALEKARALNSEHVLTYLYEGRTYALMAWRHRARGVEPRMELARAVDLYREGIKINSRFAELYNYLGMSQIEQAREEWDRGGDPGPLLDQAQKAFQQSIAVAPEQGFGYHNVGEVFIQRAWYQRARGEDPGPLVRAAGEAIGKALERIPDQAPPWTNLGAAYAILAGHELDHGGDPRKSLARASEALQQALKRNPNDAQSWRYLGEVRGIQARWLSRQRLAGAGDFENAARAFEKALALAPERQEYQLVFGHFCRMWAIGRKEAGADPVPPLERGLALANVVLAIRPTWPDARVLRAAVLDELASASVRPEEQLERRRQAREDFTRALAANPNLEREWRSRVTRLAGALDPSK